MERLKGSAWTARGTARVVLLAAILGLAALNHLGPAYAEPAPSPGGMTKLATGSDAPLRSKAWAVDIYGRLPLGFEANHGQVDAEVQFLSRGDGYGLFLTAGEAVMVFHRARHPRTAMSRRGQLGEPSVLRMQLVGANRNPRATGLVELPGRANYFIGNDPTRWRTHVPTFAKVKYENVYPGVDVVYYGNQGRLEYDLIIAPGVDPRMITLSFQGADRIEQDAEGDLIISSAAGELRQQKPVIYQEINGVRRPVLGRYVLKGTNQIGLDVTAYDTDHALVVDPTLSYSTYLSGSADTFVYGVAVDHSGSAYVTGCTTSTDFPTTHGTYQSDFQRDNPFPPDFVQPNAFVAKFNPAGSALVYSTYLGGGTDLACGSGITLDSSGNAYVTGLTGLDFPITQGAFRSAPREDIDAFVTKLNQDGSALIYSTYLGGRFPTSNNFNGAEDDGFAIAVDSAGNAYIAGRTQSLDFPTTLGAFQPGFQGRFAGFVTKVNPQGSALVYSTYLGDPAPIDLNHDFTVISGLAVDRDGHAYAVGKTSSPNFPTTPGAYQTSFGGGDYDAFVTKLSPDGASLVYSTYLGGRGSCVERFSSCLGNDEALAVAVDAGGHAYVTGKTDSINFPIVGPLAQQPTLPAVNAFITKVSPDGKALIYSTYLGGGRSQFDQPIATSGNAIAVDSAGNAFVAGSTQFDAFPTTQGAFQSTFSGGDSDVIVTKLDPTGAVLLYSTYLGGSFGDEANAIALDSSGNAYVSGTTGTGTVSCPADTQDAFPANDFPTTLQAFQPNQAGLTFCRGPFSQPRPAGGFVAKFALPANVVPLQFVRFADTLPSLPSAAVGAPYVGNIGIGGGTPPYAISLAGVLPPGVAFSSTGSTVVGAVSSEIAVAASSNSPIVAGTPTQCGTSEFTVVVQDGSGAAPITGTFSIKVDSSGHNHAIASKTGGTPNPVASEGTVGVAVTVLDSFGRAVQYAWSASCTALSSGTFSSATAPNPNWTAPVNATGSEQACTLLVTATDGECVSRVSFLQRVTSIPVVLQPLAAAILPVSRSVQVGTTATAFVSIVNAGTATATGVGIALHSPIPAQFVFQTTDPLTNQLTGTPNTPIDIPAGQRQTFVIGLTPTAAFVPIDVVFTFAGTNTAPVDPLTGINTLRLSASTTPVPDIVAQAATLNGDGVVVIPGINGTGVFSVATANQGASGNITVSADTGGGGASVSIVLCQTNPATGACTSAVGTSVTTLINAGDTPTFGVFVTGQGVVPSDPAHNRVFVRFRDAGGIEQGATSVAVRTQ